MRKDARLEAIFDALADATRRDVMQRLASRGEATATSLAEELPVTRQAIAKHLQALADAGLVTSERVGRESRYRLTPQPLTEAMGWMAEVGAAWDDRLAALRRHLQES